MTSSREFRWVFPPTGGVGEEGSHDAGLEHFRGNPMESLTREILQNSLDAAAGEGPVEVLFEEFEVRSEDLPDMKGLRAALEACRDWAEPGSRDRAWFDSALKAARAKTIRVLKISDYGTAGVGGPYGEPKTGWYDLVKSIGSSHKGQSAGGSFGIGKSAPYTVSALRAVWYTTFTEAHGFASQGVARLMAHPGPDGEMRRGFGAWGTGPQLAPATDPQLLPEKFRRGRTGTDVIVLGFAGEDGWEETVLRETIRSFHPAVSDGKLAVAAGGQRLDRETIAGAVDRILRSDPGWEAGAYYRAWASPERPFDRREIKVSGKALGEVELRLVTGGTLPKKIQRARSGGLVVDTISPYVYVPRAYAGVLMASGEELCGYLKQLEPPAHNKWEVKRADDPKEARKVLDAVKLYIDDCLRTLSEEIRSEQVELDEYAGILPGEDSGGGAAPEPGGGSSSQGWAELPLRLSRPSVLQPKEGTPGGVNPDAPGEASADVGGGGSSGGGGPTEGSGGGTEAGPAERGGPRSGRAPGPGGAEGARPAPASARAFLLDQQRRAYLVVLRPDRTVEAAYIAVRIADEEGGRTSGREVSALRGSAGLGLGIRQIGALRAFGPVRLEAGKPERFEAVLGPDAPDRAALSIEVFSSGTAGAEEESAP